MQEKTCTKCKVSKPISEFYKDKKGKYGHSSQCKCCVKLKHTQYYVANKDTIMANHKIWNDTHKDKNVEMKREWYIKNKGIQNERSKEWYENNKEFNHSLSKLWAKNNPEKRRAIVTKWDSSHKPERLIHSRTRRARKLAVNENYTIDDEQYTRQLFNNKCANCGSTEHLCIDHHYPLSKGYALTRTNAVVLCRSCNCSKSDKLPEEFYDTTTLQLIESTLK